MADKNKEEESSEIKVNDRRLFTSQGERRGDLAPEPPKQASAPVSSPSISADSPAGTTVKMAGDAPAPSVSTEVPSGDHEHAGPQGPVSFDHLVMSLATSAMFQMGMVKSPEEETPIVDLPAAKETIDLLDILVQKTKGNLTGAEQGLLDGSLYELRMVFVELTKAGRGR
jgi:hypothetical protein